MEKKRRVVGGEIWLSDSVGKKCKNATATIFLYKKKMESRKLALQAFVVLIFLSHTDRKHHGYFTHINLFWSNYYNKDIFVMGFPYNHHQLR